MKMRFATPLLGTTNRTLVSCEANQMFKVESLWATNVDSSNYKLTLWHVPAGQAVADQFALAHEQIIRPSTTLLYEAPIYLLAGDRLVAVADAADKLAVLVYGDFEG
tara:strand:- start:3720 stop:4040 length:321 start_codon:yes stop_codon:yes gene_type:complete